MNHFGYVVSEYVVAEGKCYKNWSLVNKDLWMYIKKLKIGNIIKSGSYFKKLNRKICIQITFFVLTSTIL